MNAQLHKLGGCQLNGSKLQSPALLKCHSVRRSLSTARAPLQVVAARGAKKNSQPQVNVAVDPNPSPPAPEAKKPLPLYVTIPGSFIGLIVFLRTIKAIRKRLSGNNSALADRGYTNRGAASDKYYSKLMKSMKTVSYDELSDEEIMAARMRRRREVARDMAPMDLDEIELPENHPFAVKQSLSPEEEELQRARLSARRGLSPEDMMELKRQQALADQLEEEQEQEERRRRQ